MPLHRSILHGVFFMAIDPLNEDTFPFAEAARRLPRLRGNRPVNPATIWRWASHGLRGVRLETVRIGGTICTSSEALRRFFAALAGDRPAPIAHVKSASADRTASQLDAIGI
jgi:Protein of unknown function (DUF1580)